MTRLRPVLGVVALLLVPMQALAQEVVPYERYRTELAAGLATPDRSNPPLTIDNLIALAEESAARWEAQLAWLGYVIPEPCYADAHAEVLAYLTDSIATLRDAEPLMRTADSAMGAMGILLAAVESLRATHPSAFVQASNTLGGHTADTLHILDTLATCEGPGDTLVSPAPSQVALSSPVGPRPSAGVEIFGDSGSGTKSTAPFQLTAGDYRLSYDVTSSTDYCSFGVALAATDGSSSSGIGSNGLYVYRDSPFRNETNWYVPADGRFYLDVDGDCDWEVSLAASPSAGSDAGPIELSGTALGQSPSFELSGGDYLVKYTLTSPPSDEGCDVSAQGLVDPTSPYSVIGGDIDRNIGADVIVTGETWVYAVPASRYAYAVGHAWCQFAASEPVGWTITITRQ